MNVAKSSGVSHSRIGDFARNRRSLTSANLERVLLALGFEIRAAGPVDTSLLQKADPTKVADISLMTKIAIEIYQPKRILLFGSQARGDWKPESDVDLLIIGPTTKADEGEIYLRAFKQDLRTRFEAILVSDKNFEKMRSAPNSIFSRADREGIILYER